jgi:hypothetical protein
MLNEKAKHKREKSRAWQPKIEVLFLKELRRFDNFAAFNTTSANFLSFIAARGHLNANRLQIRIKSSARFIVRV